MTRFISTLLMSCTIFCAFAQFPCNYSNTTETFEEGDIFLSVAPHRPFTGDLGIPTQLGTVDTAAVSLWGMLQLGGFTLAGERRYSGGIFGPSEDYTAGPLNVDGTAVAALCQNYDRIWHVRATEIEAHRSDFQDNETVDAPLMNVVKWPGRGNANLPDLPELDALHAPFVDLNGNGTYEPLQGEYPDVYGTLAIWSVANDLGIPNDDTQGTPVGFQIETLLTVPDQDSLPRTVFTEFYLTYRGQEPLQDFRLGMIHYPPMYCSPMAPGSFPEANLAYLVEAELDPDPNCEFVTSPTEPRRIFGQQLVSAERVADGENFNLGSVTFFEQGNSQSAWPPGLWLPEMDVEYYRNLNGQLRNGFPVGVIDTSIVLQNAVDSFFIFPDTLGWDGCSPTFPMSTYLINSGVGVGMLQPGDEFRVTYASHLTITPGRACENRAAVLKTGERVSDYYTLRQQLITDTETPTHKIGLVIAPNPARGQLQIQGLSGAVPYRLLSIDGIVVQSGETDGFVDLDSIPPGMYVLEVWDRFGRRGLERVVVR